MTEGQHVSLDPEVYKAGISQALLPFDRQKRVGANLYVLILNTIGVLHLFYVGRRH